MKLFLRTAVSLAFASIAPFAVASVDWTNQGSTNFNDGNNWTTAVGTGTVPGPGDSVHIFPGFTTVANHTTNNIDVVPGGSVTITINAPTNESIGELLVSSQFDSFPAVNGVLNYNQNVGTLSIGAGGVVITGTASVIFAGNISNTGNFIVGTLDSTIDPGQVTGNGSFVLNSGTLNNSASGTIIVGNSGGVIGSFTENGLANVAVGTGLTVGESARGSYTLNGQSTLGTTAASQINIGSASGTGTLTLNDSSTVGLTSGATMTIGNGGSGLVVQSGPASTLRLNGASSVVLGSDATSTGVYNLQDGSLRVGVTAGDTASFVIGSAVGSSGTLTQSGGNITTLAGTTFVVGGAGTGVYTMTGGTATFGSGIVVGTDGTLNLSGGQISVAEDSISTNAGTITLGGGTLVLTAGATNALTFNNISSATGGTTTIDASASGLNAFTFGNALLVSGGVTAGLNLIGDGTTVFTFASQAPGGAANTLNGSTSINGGTLNASVADLAGAVAGTTLNVGATGTLNLFTGTGAPATLGQAITGSGTLNVNFGAAGQTLELTNSTSSPSSVLIVLGANTGPKATTTSGTLQLLGGTFFGLTDNSATANSNLVIGNSVTASSVAFGDVSLGGSTTVTTNATLSAASLQSASVTNEGNLAVTNAITGSVHNDGGLTSGSVVGNVANTGTMNVTGAGGITGDVTTNSGTLNVLTGGVTGSVTNTGTFTALSTGSFLANGGYVTTVAPLGTLTVGGAYTQSINGSFGVNISGAASNSIAANSANNLVGTIIVKGAPLASGAPSVYDIITGTTGVSDNGLVLQNSFLLNTSLAVVGNALQLTVTTNALVGNTPNQNALANSLNANPNNPITNAITNNLALTAADVPAILQSLIPENLQYATFINIENVNYLVERYGGMTADLRNGNGGLDTNAISVSAPGFQSGMGRSLNSMLAYNDPAFHQSAPNGVNYYPGESGHSSPSPSARSSDATEPATFDSSSQVISDSPNPYLADVKPGTSETPALNEFIGGDVVLADLNQNPTANANNKSNYTAGGVTAGVSYRVTNHFAAGVLFDYNHTEEDFDTSGSKTKIDSFTPGIFATYFDHGFYANGLFAVGLNDYKFTNNTFLGQTSGSPSGEQYTGDLDAGYDFHPTKNWIVGPTAGLTYTHVNVDSFTEDGAPGAALNVDSQSVDSLRSRLGAHVVFQTNTGDVLLQPNLTLMWQHEFLNDSQGITSSFTNTSLNPFTINTAAPSRDSALIGLGMTATLNNSMALYLNYMADVGASNYFSQTVYGGLKARF